MTKVLLLILNAPDEMLERVAEFRRMPKAERIKAFKLAGAAVFIICCIIGGYYGPDYF